MVLVRVGAVSAEAKRDLHTSIFTDSSLQDFFAWRHYSEINHSNTQITTLTTAVLMLLGFSTPWVHLGWLQEYTHTHTHPFNGPFSGTTQVSQYQKGKTNLDFTEARDSEWQWHQLGHMQVCTLLQTDNHTSTHSVFLQAECPSCRPTNSVKALKARLQEYTRKNKMSTIQCHEKSTSSFAQLNWEWFTNHSRHKKCFALRNFQHAPSPINWLFHHCFNLNSALYT